jgi:hypothetical protein
LEAAVVETPKQFTKQPRRKKEPVKRVPLSAEARQAYEDQIKARTEREESYLRHLPSRDRT